MSLPYLAEIEQVPADLSPREPSADDLRGALPAWHPWWDQWQRDNDDRTDQKHNGRTAQPAEVKPPRKVRDQ